MSGSKEPVQVAACVLIRNERVLLIRHNEHGKHIENIYGLPGGRLEADETPIETAKRELEEETGLVTTEGDLVPLPTVWEAEVTFRDNSSVFCTMHVFLCKRYTGEVRPTLKETPEWTPVDSLSTMQLLPNTEAAVKEAVNLN